MWLNWCNQSKRMFYRPDNLRYRLTLSQTAESQATSDGAIAPTDWVRFEIGTILKIFVQSMITSQVLTDKLQKIVLKQLVCLSSLVGFVLCYLKASHHHWEMPQLWQHFPMNCSKIGHSYEAFTYRFDRNIFIRLLSENKNSAEYLWKLAITGKFG